MKTQVAVIDFGSQYTQLIVRRIREQGYLARLFQPSELNVLKEINAIILSGGPRSVKEKNAPDIDFEYLKDLNIPVLGVCYGMQLLNIKWGGQVTPGIVREYGPATLSISDPQTLLKDVSNHSQIWMSHSDTVSQLPEGCRVLGENAAGIPVALQWNEQFYGIQFHPEVSHSKEGKKILKNFLSLVKEKPAFSIATFKDELMASVRDSIGGKKVVCGVSGGVDSTVLALLLHKANINVHPIFIDTGLLRKNESKEVHDQFKQLDVNIDIIAAKDRFLSVLKGIEDPEKKRQRIGDLFLDLFWERAGNMDIFAQGTLYPDVIESATSGSIASKIKTHHNRVQRILDLHKEGKVLEPLSTLFKDEVRALGKELGIPKDMLYRHPFPGPGLAVRIPGEVTEEKISILQEADAIYIHELKQAGWYEKIWQACTTLLPCKTVGVKGDERAYEHAIVLRAVISEDAMTADWVEIPYEVLRNISNKILNEVSHVNRVLYDISTKPPASIEWE
ncbi:MAG: glutamine-hydrolyzing GMP synthase [Kiritimatiellae bacterium]|nr:glutamine-hydrolyzing GMP synthase [Kiritimatiellia bacterium]